MPSSTETDHLFAKLLRIALKGRLLVMNTMEGRELVELMDIRSDGYVLVKRRLGATQPYRIVEEWVSARCIEEMDNGPTERARADG